MSIPTCSSTSGACSSIVSSSAMSLSRSCSSIFLSSETSRRLRGLPRNGAFAILFTGTDRATLEPVLRTVACSDRSRGRRREGDFARDFIVFGAMHNPPEPCRCTSAWVRHNAVHTYVCRSAVGSVSDDPPIGKPRTKPDYSTVLSIQRTDEVWPCRWNWRGVPSARRRSLRALDSRAGRAGGHERARGGSRGGAGRLRGGVRPRQRGQGVNPGAGGG